MAYPLRPQGTPIPGRRASHEPDTTDSAFARPIRRRIVFALLAVVLSVRPARAATFATYQFGVGATTFGLAIPPGTATTGVQIGSFATQTDVKTRWPDGSIRFAVVSAQITAAGSYTLASATPPSGSFTPAWPAITVEFVISGVTWIASAGAFSTADQWLTGPVVREARVKAIPFSNGTPHPQLEVVFDIRSYNGSGHRIDMTVQNVRDAVTIDKVAATSAALKVNGTAIWTHTAVTTYSMTRWRRVAWIGATEATITPDFEPAYLAGALPRILSTVASPTYNLSGANYDVMGGTPPSGFPAVAYGEMNPDMAAGGGRPEIGAMNWWEASYLVWKTQNQRATVLRNGDLTGAWSNHLTKPDGTIIKLGDPGYSPSGWWWDGRAAVGNRPLAALTPSGNFMGTREGLTCDSDTGCLGVASRYNEEHVPAPMFLAYLLTGDRYYVDQGKFWSSRAILNSSPGWFDTDPVNFPGWKRGRNGATGNERILDFAGMTREFAWPLRLVAMTAWMIPDADADKSYFMATTQFNLNHSGDYLDKWVALGYGGALGAIGGAENASGWSLVRNGQETGRYTSTWRLAYTAYALDWCSRQSLWTISSSVDALVNRIVNIHVLMNIQNTAFLSGKSGLSHPYYPVFNTMSNGRFNKWFDTFAETKTYNETYLYLDDPNVGNPGRWNPNEAETGYYDTEHWVALQIAVRRGLPNASTAATRLWQVAGVAGDINYRAGFAITFSSGTTPQSLRPAANVTIKD
jgi:hypothetical protein